MCSDCSRHRVTLHHSHNDTFDQLERLCDAWDVRSVVAEEDFDRTFQIVMLDIANEGIHEFRNLFAADRLPFRL